MGDARGFVAFSALSTSRRVAEWESRSATLSRLLLSSMSVPWDDTWGVPHCWSPWGVTQKVSPMRCPLCRHHGRPPLFAPGLFTVTDASQLGNGLSHLVHLCFAEIPAVPTSNQHSLDTCLAQDLKGHKAPIVWHCWSGRSGTGWQKQEPLIQQLLKDLREPKVVA